MKSEYKVTARRLNSNEVIKIWRFGDCEDFVSEWQELVLDTFSYFKLQSVI